jgi:hypothetical protein
MGDIWQKDAKSPLFRSFPVLGQKITTLARQHTRKNEGNLGYISIHYTVQKYKIMRIDAIRHCSKVVRPTLKKSSMKIS